MIEEQTATVYFAPTKGRRYLTKNAALSNEARAIILEEYPSDPYEPDTGYGFDIRIDCPEAYKEMHDKLTDMLKRGDMHQTWMIDPDDIHR